MLRSAALAFVVGIGLAACGRQEVTKPSPGLRTLRIGIPSDLVSLEPASADRTTVAVLSNVFEPLVALDRDMHLVPGLATAWRSPDDLTLELDLRPGVRFHDGQVLTPALAKESLDRQRQSPSLGLLAGIQSIEVTGERRLTIRTASPDPLLLHGLASAFVATGKTQADVLARPNGTGPYLLKSWDKGQRVVLAAWDGYWGGAPAVKSAEFRVVTPGEATVDALSKTRLDLASVPLRTVLHKDRSRFALAFSSGLTTHYLFLNAATKPFSDRRVRQALALAVDRRAVARKATGHESTASPQLVPETVFGFARDLPDPVLDPVAAQDLLSKAGFPKGLDLDLPHRADDEGRLVAEVLATTLARAGIRVTPRPLRSEELVGTLAKRDVPIVLAAWSFDTIDASTFLRDCIRTRDEKAHAGLVNFGFSDPRLDALIDEASHTLGDVTRLEKLSAIMRLGQEEVPVIPLFNRPEVYGRARDLVFHPRLDGQWSVKDMAFETARPAP